MLYSLGHYRAYGIALLVVCLSVSPAYSAFDQTDKQNLYNIYELVNGINIFSMELWDWIDDRENAIDTSLSDIHNMRNWFFGNYTYHGDPFVDIVDDIRGYLEPFSHSVVSSEQPYPSSQVAVTNIAETYHLSRLYDVLSHVATNVENSYYVPFDPNIYLGGYANSSYPPETQLNLYYSKMANYYTAQHNRDFTTAQTLYKEILRQFGSWKWQAMQTYLILNPQLLIGDRIATNGLVRTLNVMLDMNNTPDGKIMRVYRDSYYDQYSTRSLREHLTRYYNNTGIDSEHFNATNFFTAEGAIENEENCFTNETSVFGKFASSFLPSGLLSPEDVDTNLFEYVDADISPTPSFNPQPLHGGTRSRSSASFDYDFEDGHDYSYNLVNPLKTATDVVQDDTDIDNKFQSLAELVNQRLSSIFDSPLNNIKQQPSRWSVKFRDKDGHTLEEYVTSQQSETQDGIKFVCWVIESTMFAGFFFTCVRRSLRIGNSGDPTT